MRQRLLSAALCLLSASAILSAQNIDDSLSFIDTNMKGNTSSDYGYPVAPSTYSTETNSVGAMGGQFTVSPMGGATYSIPIEVPMGVNGMQPSIAITYNSQAGNGVCGYGASISGLSSITRGPKNIYHDDAAYGMQYYGDDAFYLDGVRLILYSGTAGQDGAVYYPESDPYTKVLQHGTCYTGMNFMWFEVTNKAGVTCWYGYSTGRHKYYVSGNEKTLSWNLMYMVDPFGNELTVDYEIVNNVIYPVTIEYGKNNRSANPLQNYVYFNYETRPDSITYRFDNGVCGVMNRRLESITTQTYNSIYRQYNLNYDVTSDGTAYKFSRLVSVKEKNGQNDSLPATQFEWSFLPSINYQSTNLQIDEVTIIPTSLTTNNIDHLFEAGDLNGDGISDIVSIMPVQEQEGNSTVEYTIVIVFYSLMDSSGVVTFLATEDYHSIGFIGSFALTTLSMQGRMIIDLDGDGINELFIPVYKESDGAISSRMRFYMIGQNNYFNYSQIITSNNIDPLFTSSDYDNDGKSEVMYLETKQTNGTYSLHVMKKTGQPSILEQCDQYNLILSYTPKTILFNDWNGNGVQDLMVISENNYTIYWNQGNGLALSYFTDSNKLTNTNLTFHEIMKYGDFNGDGLLDIFTKESVYAWYIYINNGNGTFSKTLAYNATTYTRYDNSSNHCDVFDFDGDGKTDIVMTGTVQIGTNHWQVNTYWMRSNGSTLSLIYHATSNRYNDGLSNKYLTGDFDGDGFVELVNYGYDCAHGLNANSDPVWRIYKNSNLTAQSGKVTKITGDFGAQTNITYSTLTDPDIYARGTNTPYPAPKYTLPINVVKRTVQNNGAAGNMTTDYAYSDLRIHLQGKGMLGFCSTEVSNVTLGTTVTSTVTGWNDTFYIPSSTQTRTTIGNSYSQQATTLAILDKGQKKYFAYPSQTVERDFDANTVTTTRSIIDSIGLPAVDTVRYAQNMYKIVEYRDYIMAGRRYQPRTVVSRQRHPDDSSEFSNTIRYSYDPTTGALTRNVDGSGLSDSLTADYTYTTFGYILSKRLSGNGIGYYVQYYNYDNTKRFLTKEYSSPEAYVMEYTYDLWGNRLTEKDNSNTSYPVTITHSYDNWGNLTQTVIPGGGNISYTRGWNNSGGKRYFILTQGTGRPWVKTWYDNQGREVQTESIGPMNVNVGSINAYNSKGQVSGCTEINGDLTLSYSYTYDALGRISQENAPGGRTVSYQYGNRSVSVTENGSATTTTTYDAWGNVVSVNAPESGTITNTYYSNGGIKTTLSGGATWSFGYDARGNRASITDPDAGTTTYEYDALGRERERNDARGVEFVTNYDYLGRVTSVSASKSGTTETISYTYGTSGTGKLRLASESLNGWTKSYTYDQYGRVIEETMSKTGTTTKSKSYWYSGNGLLISAELPGDKSYYYIYDSYGNLTGVDGVDDAVTWRLSDYTGRRTVSQTTLVTDYTHPFVKTHLLDQYGLLDSIRTVQNGCNYQIEDYNFSPLTGNLTSRNLGTAYPTVYSYDNADRLTSVQYNNQTRMAMTYGSNGNILSKTGFGSYEYGSSSKPHAVTAVDNTDDMLAVVEQEVEYNLWGKVSDVWHFDGWDYCHYQIDYGPDLQRVNSVLYTNNQVEYEKFYWGDYEEKSTSGQDARYWYVNAPDGLAGVYYQENSNNGTWSHVTAVMTDHLGSIKYLVDDCDYCLYASYDPWGFRELDIEYYQPFDRGFCGHEHIEALGLIDMNGRMYDPNIGRFLSPDNYIQSPGNPQNYNRYSYCLNNPLKYTDPSGEVFVIDDAIIACIIAVAASAISDYGIQVAINYACGYTGKEAWLKKVDYFDIAVSGIVGGFTAGYGTAAKTGTKIGKFGKWIIGHGDVIQKGEILLTSAVDITGEGVQEISGKQFVSRIAIGMTTQAVSDAVIKHTKTHGMKNTSINDLDNSVMTSKWPNNLTKEIDGNYSVYEGVDEMTGKVKYVGITSREPRVRWEEHFRSNTPRSSLVFNVVPNASGLSRTDARIWEQNLINQYGLENLYNKINSISPNYWNQFNLK